MHDFTDMFAATIDAFGGEATYDPDGANQTFDCLFEVQLEPDPDSNVIVEVAIIEFHNTSLVGQTIEYGTVFEKNAKRFAAMYPPEVDEAGWSLVRARRL